MRFVCSLFWMKSLPGAAQTFSSCCCGCCEQDSAFGASSSPQLEAGTRRRCWWFSFPVWPGSFPSEHFPLPAPRCHIPRGPNGVTASCCAGGTSSLGHFPVLEPWRDYFRSVLLVLLWMTSSSWNHRALKVGKALQDGWVQPSPESHRGH